MNELCEYQNARCNDKKQILKDEILINHTIYVYSETRNNDIRNEGKIKMNT